jgi:CRISPR-associated protein Cmr6
VARSVNDLTGGGRAALYRAWHDRYQEALRGLGVEREGPLVEAATIWRLVMGFATNPALESGLTLHPLYGFPYLPGSSVRGLVRHIAEMDLLAGERETWATDAGLPDEAARATFLDEAEQVQMLLGSLSVEPLFLPREDNPRQLDPRPPLPPRAMLRRWQKVEGLPAAEVDRVRALLDLHMGGRVTFYDAVPQPGQERLLQLDLLNPHYPEYYDGQGDHPPSDDQNPRPVYFLAVRPGARFAFPFRLRPWRDDDRLHGISREAARERLRGWLVEGLTTQGAGGKTAAGYGYFAVEGRTPPEVALGPPTVAPTAPRSTGDAMPVALDWEARVRDIGMGDADRKVPQLLQQLTGEPRRQAALRLLEKFKKNLRDQKHRDKDWVVQLREAAREGEA